MLRMQNNYREYMTNSKSRLIKKSFNVAQPN